MIVEVKQVCSVKIRIPGWLKYHQLTIIGDNKELTYHTEENCAAGNYLYFPDIQPSTLKISFPLESRIMPELVAGKEYHVTWIGNQVISIDPKGVFIPLENGL